MQAWLNISREHCISEDGKARPAPIMYDIKECRECSFAVSCMYYLKLVKQVREIVKEA